MLPTKIWIVFGAQGQYSDAKEWTVCACWTEQEAQNIVSKLTEEHKLYQQKLEYLNYLQRDARDLLHTEYKKIDPFYGGSDDLVYNCYEVDIKNDLSI